MDNKRKNNGNGKVPNGAVNKKQKTDNITTNNNNYKNNNNNNNNNNKFKPKKYNSDDEDDDLGDDFDEDEELLELEEERDNNNNNNGGSQTSSTQSNKQPQVIHPHWRRPTLQPIDPANTAIGKVYYLFIYTHYTLHTLILCVTYARAPHVRCDVCLFVKINNLKEIECYLAYSYLE